MSLRLSAILVFASSAGLVFGCNSTLQTFQCETSAECASEGGRDGQCEPSRLCSFSDPSCGDEGRRYGEASGDLSNVCVGEEEEEDDDDTDGSVFNPDADAGSDHRPDAGTGPDIDADTTPPIDAMDPTCVNLNMIVYDNYEGNDEVRVDVNGNEVLVCSPDAVQPGADSMAACIYCMPIGANIKLKANSGINFEASFTDCANDCMNEKDCEFTATTTCNTAHFFDVEHTMLP